MPEGAGAPGGGGGELRPRGGDGPAAPGGPPLSLHAAAAARAPRVGPQGPGAHVRPRHAGPGLLRHPEGVCVCVCVCVGLKWQPFWVTLVGGSDVKFLVAPRRSVFSCSLGSRWLVCFHITYV